MPTDGAGSWRAQGQCQRLVGAGVGEERAGDVDGGLPNPKVSGLAVMPLKAPEAVPPTENGTEAVSVGVGETVMGMLNVPSLSLTVSLAVAELHEHRLVDGHRVDRRAAEAVPPSACPG